MTGTLDLRLPTSPLSRWAKFAHAVVGVAVGILTTSLLVRLSIAGLHLFGFTAPPSAVLAIVLCFYAPIAWLMWRRWKYVAVGTVVYATAYLLLILSSVILWGIARMR
ncbi:MAG TPA: hypothetical protein VMC85_18350 [Desulfomonilaceae bacterium]|nr:hypothetical protein [Desulfomonilaceae bacterium]